MAKHKNIKRAVRPVGWVFDSFQPIIHHEAIQKFQHISYFRDPETILRRDVRVVECV